MKFFIIFIMILIFNQKDSFAGCWSNTSIDFIFATAASSKGYFFLFLSLTIKQRNIISKITNKNTMILYKAELFCSFFSPSFVLFYTSISCSGIFFLFWLVYFSFFHIFLNIFLRSAILFYLFNFAFMDFVSFNSLFSLFFWTSLFLLFQILMRTYTFTVLLWHPFLQTEQISTVSHLS